MNEEDYIMRQIKTVGKSLASIFGKKEGSIDIILEEENSDPATDVTDDTFPIDYEAFEAIKKDRPDWLL